MDSFFNILNRVIFTIGEEAEITVLEIGIALLILLVGVWLARWTDRRLRSELEEHKVDAGVVQLIRRLFYILVIVVLLVTTLDLLKIPLTAFAFISGAVAIGVGFGAQNIINNFISGWVLMWERSIRIGDFLEMGNMLGTVETINTRYTRVRRIDGVRLIVPNSQFLETTVINWSMVDKKLRSSVRVGVQYGSDVQKVRQLLEELLANNPDILDDPAPVVVFEDFGDSALVFDAFFWIVSAPDRTLRGVRSALRFKIAEIFKENGIVIAFPQRDVHVDGTLKIEK